jgi:hypothetical protein
VNALANDKVAKELNENFVSTYMKVGKFQIINGVKVGGNVASYFCLPDGSVLHAVAGQMDARKMLNESRWALDTRKAAQTAGTNLDTGKLDRNRFALEVRKAHGERYHLAMNNHFGDKNVIPKKMPLLATPEAKTHWLLASQPLDKLDRIYPVVWRQILNEQLSALPVDKH